MRVEEEKIISEGFKTEYLESRCVEKKKFYG